MVRFGIVGFGLHAVKRLMPGFAKASNCRVTALSRRDPEQAAASAEEYGVPHAFTSVEELCSSPEVDAVFVTTPNACHLNDVLVAARHSKHILCEKPMAMTAAECRQMVEAAAKARIQLGIAHVFRFNESVNRIREIVAAGQIGRPVFAHCDFSFFAAGGHPRKWLYDRSIAGGGPISDVGVHCIDTLRYILDDEITEVTTLGTTDEHSGTVEASATMSLRFSRGALGTSSVSYRAEYHTPILIRGERGSITAHDGLAVDTLINVVVEHDRKIVSQGTFSNELSYAKQVDEFANAIEGKTTFRASGEQGWRNQAVLDAAFRSIQSGKAEKVESLQTSARI